MPDRLVIKELGIDTEVYDFQSTLDSIIQARSRILAKQREAYCRELLEARMPGRLHWLLDHPRLLKRVLRVVKRWEPTLTFVNLNRPEFATGGLVARASYVRARKSAGMTAEAATHLSKVALHGAEQDGAGVFTYTDPSGLPAEVYGPVAPTPLPPG